MEPPIGAPPREPGRMLPSRAGSTRSRAMPKTYRATELWKLIIAARIEVISRMLAKPATRPP
jgi:hypothetical protein